jgi:hypothetical protein
MSTSTALPPAPSRELPANRPGRWRRLRQRLMPPVSVDTDQLNQQLAVLETARAELQSGWVQGTWLALGRPAAGGPVHVDGVCLVGGLLRAGPGAGRAVDAVYDALWASRGQAELPGPRPVPSPEVRQARVRTLTKWNDQPGRTQADVLALVDQAISATIMDLMSAPRPASPPEPAIKLGA